MFPCKECENVSSIPLISPYLLDYNRSQIAVRAPHWPEGAGLTDLLPGNSADPWDITRASVMEQTLWQRLISNLDRIGADKTRQPGRSSAEEAPGGHRTDDLTSLPAMG